MTDEETADRIATLEHRFENLLGFTEDHAKQTRHALLEVNRRIDRLEDELRQLANPH